VCLRVFYVSVRFNDAIDGADADALGGIEMALAFHTGGLIDHIGDAIAFADGLSRAFGYASATGDAVFSNFHCHGRYSFKDLLARIQNYPMPQTPSIDKHLLFGEFCHNS
jgi:hypothetical protein